MGSARFSECRELFVGTRRCQEQLSTTSLPPPPPPGPAHTRKYRFYGIWTEAAAAGTGGGGHVCAGYSASGVVSGGYEGS